MLGEMQQEKGVVGVRGDGVNRTHIFFFTQKYTTGSSGMVFSYELIKKMIQ
jgi:hypothetical protein